jgi:hypothetical protein
MLTINNTLDGYLKDVEIKGNTIQDIENLADIRSVGDKVEGQELYEIPVLSVGKNIWNTTISIFNNNKYLCTPNYSREVGVKLPKNSSWTLSFEKITRDARVYIWGGNNSVREVNPNISNKVSFTLNGDEDGISFYAGNFGNSPYDEITTDFKIQLEEGTQATPYEPYVEDKLTILSPTQLEKVGDVCDRIIEKDGVWGVEKNVIDKLFNGSENWVLSGWAPQENTIAFKLQNTNNTNLGICDKFILNRNNSTIDTEAFNVDSVWNEISIRINKSKLSTQDVTGFKKWLSDNTVLIMYSDNTSTFIPLPHDQQIKLRTFANKTNISFLTEIEGTIKAQVPKSLGATINTHNEQINNLNKELDRVKKLEESTVSTVNTESGFTTVEQTTNGYFEDVKLEGKTLVNIYPKATPTLSVADRDNPKYNVTKKEGYIKITGSDLEATNYRYVNMGRINFEMFKPNTTYTVIFTKFRGSSRITIQNGNSQHPIVKGGSFNAQDNKLVYTFVTTETLVKSEQILYLWIDPKSTTVDVEAENPMIFEGDLTANPPSGYIEGLKSVGDGVDEISVESINENLFTTSKIVVQDNLPISYEPTPDGIRVSSDNALGFGVNLKLKAGNTYYFSGKSSNIVNVRLYRKGGITWEDVIFEIAKEEVNCASFSKSYVCTKDTEVYFRFWKTPGTSTITDVVVSKTPHANPIRGEHDKKRLLYYNEETQTWEKPILREGDSIEKHANGKYYYHQRSAEVVLNGSENWNNDKNSSTMSPETYRQSIQFNAIDIPSASFNTKTSPNIISDLLPTVIFGDVYSYNHIGISISGTDSIGTHIIINNNFTDVTELKQWLQANNLTVVYQLAEEKVYECTNIDLITYNGETNFIVESGVLSPKTTLKVHNNISNVVSLLQKKVSLLESNMTKYMITQNRLQLSSTHSADSVTFKVDYTVCSENISQENYDTDLYNLILNNILVGKDNYNYDHMFNIIMDYASWSQISWDQFDILVGLMDIQHNPPIEEIPTDDEIVEEIPNEIM